MESSDHEDDVVPINSSNVLQYYTFVSETNNSNNHRSLEYTCKRCNKSFRTDPSSKSNLKRHLKDTHHISVAIKRQKTVGDVNERVRRFILDVNAPLRVIEYASFRNLFAPADRKKLILSTETMRQSLKDDFKNYQVHLKDIFRDLQAVALTADAWSSYHRSFLGMTASWIDEQSLKRKVAVIALKRVIGSMTYEVIREKFVEVMEMYGIREKVVSITTDNGSNFVKCMLLHGSNNDSTSENHTDVDIEIISIDDLRPDDNDSLLPALPKHIRCAAHGLNLVAKSFETKLNKQSLFWTQYDSVLVKCKALWHCQSTSVKNADEIRRICGSLFVCPAATRWLYLLLAFNDIYKKKNKINIVMQTLKLNKTFRETDFEFLENFIKIMKPFKAGLDCLQGDSEGSFYGCFYVVITRIKARLTDLGKDSDINMLPFIQLLLKELDSRFSKYMGDDERLAAAINPFCLRLEKNLKTYALRHLAELQSYCTATNLGEPGTERVQQDSDDLFSVSQNIQDEHDCMFAVFLSKERSINSLHEEAFKCVKSIFIRLQTPLPTSASVERAFSKGKRAFPYDRTQMSDELLEIRVCMGQIM